MPEVKSNAAFISHSSKDTALAGHLNDLITACGLRSYLACEDLPAAGATDWTEDISNNIRNSTSFVPILSPHSVRRPWVLYEAGIARGAGDVLTHPVHTDSIDPGTGPMSPIIERQQSYNLSSRDLVAKFLRTIYHHHENGRHSVPNGAVASHVKNILRKKKNAHTLRKITMLAKRRSVFIAGSLPAESTVTDEINVHGKPESPKAALKTICQELTEELLERHFVVASCPEVSFVGATVADTAERYARRNERRLGEIYEIGGLYRLAIPEGRKSQNAKSKIWQDVYEQFRMSYLQNYEMLVVIGGNVGTQQEYSAALQCPMAITSIPLVGGFGGRIWTDLNDKWKIAHGAMGSWSKYSARTFADNLLKNWPDMFTVRSLAKH